MAMQMTLLTAGCAGKRSMPHPLRQILLRYVTEMLTAGAISMQAHLRWIAHMGDMLLARHQVMRTYLAALSVPIKRHISTRTAPLGWQPFTPQRAQAFRQGVRPYARACAFRCPLNGPCGMSVGSSILHASLTLQPVELY